MLLIRGSIGPQVTTLQENLNTVGVTVDVDGTYGPGTEAGVKTFQTANGISADGKYGDGTHAKMEELLAQMSGGQS
jgi:peptidoglycan hydrolase-like protein with peptidoglycan-binding domain